LEGQRPEKWQSEAAGMAVGAALTENEIMRVVMMDDLIQ
jgi:hypothetical protein